MVILVAIEKKPSYDGRIVQDPAILTGKPTVKGTRIPVELVVGYLARNPNFEDLFADYPRLTMDDVKACLAYAQDLMQKQRDKHPRGVLPPANV